VGLALYAHGQSGAAAAALFGAIGFVTGALCAAFSPWRRTAAPRPEPVSAEALASLLRATLASAASERAARPGSAADRRPAQIAAAALAQAAAPAAAQPMAAVPSAQPTPRGTPAAGAPRQFASSAFGG
jgi:hypothetical protein